MMNGQRGVRVWWCHASHSLQGRFLSMLFLGCPQPKIPLPYICCSLLFLSPSSSCGMDGLRWCHVVGIETRNLSAKFVE
jgi:hypothetical protein